MSGPAEPGTTLEILVVRDPDGGTDITIWADGVNVTRQASVFTVDAGAGYDVADWIESTEHDLESTTHEAVHDAIRAARCDPPGSEHIDGWESRHVNQQGDPCANPGPAELCWSGCKPDEDESDRDCVGCGETAEYLSSQGLCDGCVEAGDVDTMSSASRQHFIDTGRYLRRGEATDHG